MSKYTTQIRFLIEMNSDETLPMTKRIEQACSKIFNFDYPIWSQEYKKTLEKKILMHYFNKEIGLETMGLWKLYLEERLNLIMPYYNELYTTVSKKYEWLEDINVAENYTGDKKVLTSVDERIKGIVNETSKNGIENIINDTNNSTNTGETKDQGKDISNSKLNENKKETASKENTDLKSDLPQANFKGLDYGTELNEHKGNNIVTSLNESSSESAIDRNSTVTTKNNVNTTSLKNEKTDSNSIRDMTNENTGNTKSDTMTNDLFERVNKGLSGARSRTTLNMEYRQSLINIDKMIIEELADLFMLIY